MRAQLLQWLRVPPEPQPPEGSPDSIRIFRAGRNYYRWLLFVWALTWTAAFLPSLLLLAVTLGNKKMPALVHKLFLGGEVVVLAILLVMMPLSFFAQQLVYELRWYIVTDRSLRIRTGIWNVQELTMTFANVQDLRITAGPIQGYLGLADLEVTSAGGGDDKPGHRDTAHTARFEGVDNAEQIRDLIQDRLRRYRDAGLGDPAAPITPESAAVELLTEARALRAAVAAPTQPPPSRSSI
jgi:membrane protein YdbS with pleckstrin-like domain